MGLLCFWGYLSLLCSVRECPLIIRSTEFLLNRYMTIFARLPTTHSPNSDGPVTHRQSHVVSGSQQHTMCSNLCRGRQMDANFNEGMILALGRRGHKRSPPTHRRVRWRAKKSGHIRSLSLELLLQPGHTAANHKRIHMQVAQPPHLEASTECSSRALFSNVARPSSTETPQLHGCVMGAMGCPYEE